MISIMLAVLIYEAHFEFEFDLNFPFSFELSKLVLIEKKRFLNSFVNYAWKT